LDETIHLYQIKKLQRFFILYFNLISLLLIYFCKLIGSRIEFRFFGQATAYSLNYPKLFIHKFCKMNAFLRIYCPFPPALWWLMSYHSTVQ